MGRSVPSQPLCWSCGSPRLQLTSILAPTLLSSTILPPIYGLHFPVHVTAFLGSPTLISLHFHQNACSKMTVSPFSENPLRDQHCALTGEGTACDASTPHGQWFQSWLLYSRPTSVWPGPGLCSHLGSKSVDRKTSPCICLSLTLPSKKLNLFQKISR